MISNLPVGQRFSHLYLAAGEPITDSKRMRARLAAIAPLGTDLHKHLNAELGVPVSFMHHGRNGPTGVDPKFFHSAELRDVLDAITVIYHRVLGSYPTTATQWLTDVRRVFVEENLGYSIDDAGGVHYAVDSVFEAVKAGALSSLRFPRYANALSMFEQGLRSMDAIPADGKAAIRSTFAAAEGLFRVMYPDAPRLGGAEVERYLSTEVSSLYSTDATARHAGGKLLGSFKNWIDGAHFYRHEPGQHEVAQPPLALAVLIIQEGAGFIRWLAHVDSQRRR